MMNKRTEHIPLSVPQADFIARQAVARQGMIFSRQKHCSSHFISRICKVPAAQALLLQCAAFIAVLSSVLVVDYFIPLRFDIFALALMQALFATGICMLTRMANWWRCIHFVFPIALWGMSQWQLPNEIYLAGFLLSLSLFWTTFRSQVPFYPSRSSIRQQVVDILPKNRPVRMIDIGSGLGDFVMHIANQRPDSRIEGIEIAPLPWLLSKLRAWLKKSTAIFKLGDYQLLDFSEYDMVFAYLSPAAMPALWQKARKEMRPGSLLVSYEFEIPGVKPSLSIACKGHAAKIYVWKI